MVPSLPFYRHSEQPLTHYSLWCYQVGPILDILKFHLNEANTFQLFNGQLFYVFQTAEEENFGHSTSLESVCNQPTTFQQDLPLLFSKWPGLNYGHHTAVGGNKKMGNYQHPHYGHTSSSSRHEELRSERNKRTVRKTLILPSVHNKNQRGVLQEVLQRKGKRSSSRYEEGGETRKLDKPREHITLAFCLQGKPYHSEAPTLSRCWASGMLAPESAASVAAPGDWPLPLPSEAVSRDRASVPQPHQMETALSRGSAAVPGPSAAHRGPKPAPPAATVKAVKTKLKKFVERERKKEKKE